MAQHLSNIGKLNALRRDRFSSKFMEDLDTLVGSVAMEICNKHVQVHALYSHTASHVYHKMFLHVQDGEYAKRLNTSLAFFIHDALSLMDRGFVFVLIKTYLKKVSDLLSADQFVDDLPPFSSLFQSRTSTCLSSGWISFALFVLMSTISS